MKNGPVCSQRLSLLLFCECAFVVFDNSRRSHYPSSIQISSRHIVDCFCVSFLHHAQHRHRALVVSPDTRDIIFGRFFLRSYSYVVIVLGLSVELAVFSLDSGEGNDSKRLKLLTFLTLGVLPVLYVYFIDTLFAFLNCTPVGYVLRNSGFWD